MKSAKRNELPLIANNLNATALEPAYINGPGVLEGHSGQRQGIVFYSYRQSSGLGDLLFFIRIALSVANGFLVY